MQRFTCMVFINFAHCYGKRPCQRARSQLAIFAYECRSQASERGIWPGNKTSCAHAYKIRKWRPSQRTATTECVAFIDQGEFEAMKTLSGWEAARCDEYPFCAKIKVSARSVFELSLFEQKS